MKSKKKSRKKKDSVPQDIDKGVASLYDGAYLKGPINITITDATTITCSPLIWNNYDDLPTKLLITNTGKTVLLHGTWETNRPSLEKGPLMDKYVFCQLHFHWGKNFCEGSEHTVDGMRHSMELHAVHFKREYLFPEVAKKQKDGLAIVAYILKLQPGVNHNLDYLLSKLPEVKYTNSACKLEPFALSSIFHTFPKDFFFYKGTMSTLDDSDSCSALWLIARQVIGVAEVQIHEFQKLLSPIKRPIIQETKSVDVLKKYKIHFINPSPAQNASLLAPIWVPPKEN